MWTVENRRRYNRDTLRYPSDLTEEEWSLVEPLIRPAKPGGNRRRVNVREVMNGILYVLSTGCQWRAVTNYFRNRFFLFLFISSCGKGISMLFSFRVL